MNSKARAAIWSRKKGYEHRKRRLSALAVLVVVIASAMPVHADYDKGVQAWESGQYREAISEWMAAADADDGRAMLEIGRAHLQGLGVLQDFVEAHKWFNLAASREVREALEERDALSERMTADDLAQAQNLARQWRPGGGATESAAAGTGTPSEAPKPPPEAIREAQALLKALGYEPGPSDGIWGQRTGSAYRSFLRDAGMPPGETLGLDALLAMRKIAGEKGVKVQIDTSAGSTRTSRSAQPPDTLHRAARAGDIAGLRAALEAGSDVDRLDGQGWTALMHAVNQDNVPMAESLLKGGADVDIQAPDGATALFMAAVLGRTEIVGLLMRVGADISIQGPKGRTAVDMARLTFGDADDVRSRGMPPEVVLLVSGPFRDCEACPEMVVVPAGSFMMGSPGSEEGRSDNEGPVHRVEIPHRFAVGKYEVTRGQFAEFAGQTGYKTAKGCTIWTGSEWKDSTAHSWRNPGFRQGDDHPVACVSWNDAQEYVRWLSRETGEEYRLLSESEWEYAARAGTTTAYHFGSDISSSQAKYGRKQGGTVPVGGYPPNEFGLHDVHGNVLEWVEDCRNDDYHGAPSNGSAWISGHCDWRMGRGGSWRFHSKLLRSAQRFVGNPGNRSVNVGFRVARTLAP